MNPRQEIISKHPQGQIYKPCTEFAKDVVKGIPKVGLTLKDKLKAGKKHGITKELWNHIGPKIGDTLITDEKTAYGHIVVVNKVDKNKVTLSESNYAGHNKVTHTRTLQRNSPKIKYILRTKVK